MAEIHEIIEKIVYQTDTTDLKQTQKTLTDTKTVTSNLAKEIIATEIAMKSATKTEDVKKLNKELTLLQAQYKNVNGEILDTGKALANLVNGADLDQLKNLFNENDLLNIDSKLQGITDEMEQLGVISTELKAKLSGLDKNSQEYEELSRVIELTDASMIEFANGMEAVEGKSKSVKSELRSIRDRMNELELAGEATSDEFLKLQNRAGELQDQMDATASRIKILASDTKNIDFGIEAIQTVTAAFEVGAGAAALFGVEEEELQKVQTKLIALIAIANGLQQIQNALQKEGTLRVVGHELATKLMTATQAAYTAVVGTSTGALKAFKLALAATGIGLVVVAIGALVANWDKLSESISGTTKAQKELNEINKQALDDSKGELINLKLLYDATQDTTKSLKERKVAVDELQKQYPNYFGNLKDEAILAGNAASAYYAVRDAIIASARAQALRSKLADAYSAQLDKELELDKQIELSTIKLGASTKKVQQELTVNGKKILADVQTTKTGYEDASRLANNNLNALKEQKKQSQAQFENDNRLLFQQLAESENLSSKLIDKSQKITTAKAKQQTKTVLDEYSVQLKSLNELKNKQILKEEQNFTELQSINQDNEFQTELHKLKLLKIEERYLNDLKKIQEDPKYKKQNEVINTDIDIEKTKQSILDQWQEVQKADFNVEPLKLDTEVKLEPGIVPEIKPVDIPAKVKITTNKEEIKAALNTFSSLVESPEFQSLFTNTADLFGQLAASAAKEVQGFEEQIQTQNKELERSKEIADRGNAQLYQEQKERLVQLEAKRDEARKRELQYTQIQNIANQALAFSYALAAVAKAAVEGGGLGSIATVAAVIGALASGYAFIQSFKAPELAEGIERFDLTKGNERLYNSNIKEGRDKYPAWLDKHERVTPASINNELRSIAGYDIPNAQLPNFIRDAIKFRELPMINNSALQNAVIMVQHSKDNEIKELREDFNNLLIMFGNIKIKETNLDPNGMVKLTERKLLGRKAKNIYRG